MKVENHPKWKETNIVRTHFPLPWLWEEGYSRPSKFDRQTWRNQTPQNGSDAREIAAVSGAVGYDLDVWGATKELWVCWYMI